MGSPAECPYGVTVGSAWKDAGEKAAARAMENPTPENNREAMRYRRQGQGTGCRGCREIVDEEGSGA